MSARHFQLRALLVVIGILAVAIRGLAHDGPPFPILSNRLAGPYEISIWTDPDATDDGTAGGQFWVLLRAAAKGTDVPAETRATVAIRPANRQGPELVARASPVDGRVGRQFAALAMDHEGRFAVRVTVEGALGRAEVSSEVDATYDLRPPPLLLAVYLLPFLALGVLWIKLLRQRGRARVEPRAHRMPAGASAPPSDRL